jgi:hypothetical protein
VVNLLSNELFQEVIFLFVYRQGHGVVILEGCLRTEDFRMKMSCAEYVCFCR